MPSYLSGAHGLESRGLLSNECPRGWLRGAFWGYVPIFPMPIFNNFRQLPREIESLSRTGSKNVLRRPTIASIETAATDDHRDAFAHSCADVPNRPSSVPDVGPSSADFIGNLVLYRAPVVIVGHREQKQAATPAGLLPLVADLHLFS